MELKKWPQVKWALTLSGGPIAVAAAGLAYCAWPSLLLDSPTLDVVLGNAQAPVVSPGRHCSKHASVCTMQHPRYIHSDGVHLLDMQHNQQTQ